MKQTTGAVIIGYNMYYEAIPHWDGSGALGEFMELDKVEVKDEPNVTHFTYRFKKG